MQPDLAALEAYEARLQQLSDFGPVAEHLIAELVRAEGIQAHSVTHRLKSKQSFRRKLSEKGDSYSSIDAVHDILGVRVITYFPDEVDAVAEIMDREFAVNAEHSVDKRAVLNPDSFGYLSLHYVCELDSVHCARTELRRFEGLLFEIQVRSILQHAWAEIEHDLGYHTEGAVPSGVRRRFSRLAGLLELADAEFEGIRNELVEYREALISERVPDAGIDRDSIGAFIRTNPAVAQIDSYLSKKFVGKLAPTSEVFASRTADKLQAVGVSTIAELSELLTDRIDVVERFADEWLGDSVNKSADAGISLFYLWYVLLVERFEPAQQVELLASQGFGGPDKLVQKLLHAHAVATSP